MLTFPVTLMWSRKLRDTFNISNSICKTQQLFKHKGFLAEPAYRHGKQLRKNKLKKTFFSTIEYILQNK